MHFITFKVATLVHDVRRTSILECPNLVWFQGLDLMLSAKCAINRFSHGLCPSVVSLLLIDRPAYPASCLHTLRKRDITRKANLNRNSSFTSEPLHLATHGSDGQRIRGQRDGDQSYNKVLARPLWRKLTKSDIYEELRRASVRGNYLKVREIVEVLVKERNEAPNARIYLALILANTDPQDGSPAEVERLLVEMIAENIVPDSAAYHAVLKVKSGRIRKTRIATNINEGTCITSRLQFSKSCTRGAAAKMVHIDKRRVARCYCRSSPGPSN